MELLAPVGSISALKAAISAGADAVYLGLSEHNARIKADAFDASNLKEWVEYAHLFHVKVHITLNTAVKNEEWERVLFLAKTAVESGADALIVSDLGLIHALSERTDIPLHLSTQAGAQNALDARFARSLGATRVILARETVDADIPTICKEISETECFVQGALCVSFSGGCLLGSIEYGSSGNRGVCNQACRMRYTATDETGTEIKSGYLLSPYDLSRGEDVLSLSSCGVTSAKIEGRLKRAVYVYYAVAYYRAILDGKDPSFALENLKKAFNRGFTKGYTLRKCDKIIGTSVPTHIGVAVGKIEKIVTKNGYKYAYLRSTHPFRKGDGAKILRNGVEVGGSDVTSARTEGGFSVIPVSDGVRIGDEVRLTTDSAVIERIERLTPKLPVSIRVFGKIGERLSVTASYEDRSVTETSEYVLEPGREAGNPSLREKLTKLGNTDFIVSAYSDLTETPVFLPIKEVNDIRRRLTDRLREEIIRKNTPKYHFISERSDVFEELPQKNDVVVEVESPLSEVKDIATAFVLDLPAVTSAEVKKAVESLGGKTCYLRLPRIARGADLTYIEKLLNEVPTVGIYTDSMYGVQLARENSRRYIVGTGLNVFNMKTAALFRDADRICSSIECEEAGDLRFAGGKVALMNFAHCPVSVVYGRRCDSCDRNVDNLYYTNGNRRYRIRRNVWRDCCFTMYRDTLSYRRVQGARLYSFVGLTADERKALIERIKEERSV